MTKNEINLNDTITENHVSKKSIFDGRYNKTSQFLLPALGIKLESSIMKEHLINAYLDDKGWDHDHVKPIFLLLKSKDIITINWRKTVDTLIKNESFIQTYDPGFKDGYFLTMFVFKCPDKWKNDYTHFKKGEYSKFSKEYKKLFSELTTDEKGSLIKSIPYSVVNKTELVKRKMEKEFGYEVGYFDDLEEIWDLPRKEQEYYRYKP